MTSVRTGEWHLLGYDTDPVPASDSDLDPVIKHYRELTDAMAKQAAVLKRIGDGDETDLAGKAADAMRKRARESNEALSRASGRYQDVRDALVTYQPELRAARSETQLALNDAVAAEDSRRAAEGMPDPAGQNRPPGAAPPTDAENKASEDRTRRLAGATDAADAAKARAERALSALATAARTASDTIRKRWGSDGLHTTGWDAFVYGLNKFLKGLVEVLGYIGMALAVISLLIPGLNFITAAGVIVASVSLLASVVLAAQGEGSWLSVLTGVLGLVGIGVAAKVASSLKVLQAKGLAQGRVAFGRGNQQIPNLLRDKDWLSRLTPTPSVVSRLWDVSLDLKTLGTRLRAWQDFSLKTSVSPGWWQVFTKPGWVLKVDISRFKAQFADGITGIPKNYRWDRLIGVSDIRDVLKINAATAGLGLAPLATKGWAYFGPVSFTLGWLLRPIGLLGGSGLNPNDLRNSFTGFRDANYAGFYSENPVL